MGVLILSGSLMLSLWLTRNNWRHYRRGAFPMSGGGALTREQVGPVHFGLLAIGYVGGAAFISLAAAAALFLFTLGRL